MLEVFSYRLAKFTVLYFMLEVFSLASRVNEEISPWSDNFNRSNLIGYLSLAESSDWLSEFSRIYSLAT
jgi:hypothetical protein